MTSKIPRTLRLGAMAGVLALAASACRVVQFDYGAVDPIPPWDADSYVESEFGPGFYVWEGYVYDPEGHNILCEDTGADGNWTALGYVFSPDGPLWCGST
jgi:hypothetical protein